jgi:hypothetical protein
VVILIVGSSVLILGVVMLDTPGPAIVVTPLGLSILAIESAWAQRWLKQVTAKAAGVAGKARGRRSTPAGELPAVVDPESADPVDATGDGEAPRG